ncbi:MAG: glycosyltransferase [Spirochaetes bacterium]|nr:glycosyltransferase [Spirochaetota bacterium]
MIKEKVSILIPVYNMEATIQANLIKGVAIFRRFMADFEIVACNDGSSDATLASMRAAAKRFPDIIRVVTYPINRGKGYALKRAFEHARGSYIALCDADMELEPGQLKRFFEIMRETDADVVIGSKRHPESKINYSLNRRIASTIYYYFIKIFFRLPIRDTQTGLKLFKRGVLTRIFPRVLVKQFAFDLEILAASHRQGYRIVDAPVNLLAIRNMRFPRIGVVWRTFYDTMAILFRHMILRYYDELFDEIRERPLVSIIIPSGRMNKRLSQTVDAIIAGDYDRFEIIILPDKAEKNSAVSFHNRRVRIVPTGAVTFAEKRNIGARSAKGAVLAFLDDASYPEHNWMTNALRALYTSEEKAVCGPAINAVDDDFWSMLGGAVLSSVLVSGNYRYRYMLDRPRRVNDFPSCNFFIRKDFFIAIGGYDAVPFGEDAIFCQKIIDNKGAILYTPEVIVSQHRQRLFSGHCRQLAAFARQRGVLVRTVAGNSLVPSYFVPSLFVLYLIAAPVLSVFVPAAAVFALAPLAIYVICVTLSSLVTMSVPGFAVKFAGIVVSHVVYGVSFARGFFTGKLSARSAKQNS